jgi:hypothetical protein
MAIKTTSGVISHNVEKFLRRNSRSLFPFISQIIDSLMSEYNSHFPYL